MWKSWIWRYWLGWLGRTVATAVLVSFLCIWTTGFIVNSYIKALLKQYNISLEQEPFVMTGIWGVLWGGGQKPAAGEDDGSLPAWIADNDDKDRAQEEHRASGAQGAEKDRVQGAYQGGAYRETVQGEGGDKPQGTEQEQTEQGQGNGQGPGQGLDQGKAQGTDQGSGQDSGPGNGLDNGLGTVSDSSENVPDGSGRLSDEERQRLYATLLNKLSADQLNRLSDWMEGGLTDEEMENLETMLRGVLNENEIRQLREILGPLREDFPGP